MAERPLPDDPALATAARHALHDEELIAAFAAGAAETDEEATRAASLIERCATCAGLAEDLRAITAGVRALPAAERAIGLDIAPRDFRLTVEQATRLGGRPPITRRIGRVAAALASFGRPVGASLAAMGIVGLFAGSVSLGAFGPASLPAAPGGAGTTSESAQSQAPDGSTFRLAGGEPAPGSSIRDESEFTTAATSDPGDTAVPDAGEAEITSGGLWTWVIGGSALLLVGGAGLALLGGRARRALADRPGRADRS